MGKVFVFFWLSLKHTNESAVYRLEARVAQREKFCPAKVEIILAHDTPREWP